MTKLASRLHAACVRAGLLLAVLVALGVAETAALAQTSAGEGEPQAQTEEQASSFPIMVLRAFGAVNWGATQEHDSPNTFTLGQFAFFATSALTDRVSVLAEIVLEGGTDTRVVTDLERLQLTYRFNDHLQLTAGRYHTGIGFYNAAFHHGAFFETPVGRPRAFAFEDEGGVLPVHDVGLTVRGAVPHTDSSLHYLAEIGNGRNWLASHEGEETEESKKDQNGDKAVNFGLSFHPERWRGFEVGASYYRDSIVENEETEREVAHGIGATYVVYRTPATEIMVEWLRLTHRTPEGQSYVNNAGYVQLARAVRGVKPYYRYDRLQIDAATPFIGAIESFTGHTIGLRVDVGQWVGIKAQYEHANHASQRGVDAFRTQLVFVF
jgi:hypothetical protein